MCIILFLSIFVIVKSDKISSIDGREPRVSLESTNFVDGLEVYKEVGESVLSLAQSNTIVGDKNIPLSVVFETSNGEIGSEMPTLLLITKNKKLLIDSEIHFDSGLSTDVQHSKTSKNVLQKNNTIASVQCQMQFTKFEMLITSNVTLSNQVTEGKFGQVDFITFYLNYSTNQLSAVNVGKNRKINFTNVDEFDSSAVKILNKIPILNFCIVNQYFLHKKFIVIQGEKNVFYVYSLELNFSDFSFALHPHKTPFKINVNNMTRCGFLDDDFNYLLVSDYHKGFFIHSFSTNFTSDSLSPNTGITDFVLLKDGIYALAKSKGLYFYKYTLSDNLQKIIQLISLYPHKNFLSIDLVINPFNGNKFLGIQLKTPNNPKDGNEFFIELLLYKENTPVLNKIFTLEMKKSHSEIFHLKIDSFNSLFYDKENQELFFVRRGMLSTIPFVSFKIALKVEKMFPLFNKETGYNTLVQVYHSASKVLEKIVYPSYNLTCTFAEPGKYAVRFLSKVDSCNEIFEKKYSVCRKVVDFPYLIYDKPSKTGLIVCIFFVGIAFFAVFLILSCCFVINKKKIKVEMSVLEKRNIHKIYELEEEDFEDESHRSGFYKDKNEDISDLQYRKIKLKSGIEILNSESSRRTDTSMRKATSFCNILHKESSDLFNRDSALETKNSGLDESLDKKK